MKNRKHKTQTRPKNEPQLIGKIMKGLESNPESYLFHILKMGKA